MLAIIVGKLLVAVGRLLGKGSSTPGAVALRLCPTLDRRFVLPAVRVAVTGSSGKGSVSALIAASLRQMGFSVVHNSEGSNMRAGIVAMLLAAADVRGRVSADVVVTEVDERSCKHVFPAFQPGFVVITNITRDQPPRQVHTDYIFTEIERALSGNELLLVNGDDPLLMRFGLPRVAGQQPYSSGQQAGQDVSAVEQDAVGAGQGSDAPSRRLLTYGLGKHRSMHKARHCGPDPHSFAPSTTAKMGYATSESGSTALTDTFLAASDFKTAESRFDVFDAAFCPLCGQRLSYDYYLINSTGGFSCPEGHFSHRIDLAVSELRRGAADDGSADTICLQDGPTIQANSRLLFNVFNVVAAYALLTQLPLGIDKEQAALALSQQAVSKKIFHAYRWRGRPTYVMSNKAENAATFDQSLLFAANLPGPLVLVVGWMEISRRYQADDISWLYDVNFELVAERLSAAICTGPDAASIAVRLKYAEVDERCIHVFADMDARVAGALEATEGSIVAVLNFDHVRPFIRLIQGEGAS
ncbi:MAG: MurT ligase domain-containing protein [Actinomycetia bacterium]|nr:MurT ligase domain-containing protein [Actinomycetes bacterium]